VTRTRDQRPETRDQRLISVRYLILSDIHANLEALEAVLAAAGHWDAVLVLGDLVGYGADPNRVIDRVRSLNPLAVIRGNHDKVACGLEDASNFNQVARVAALWTNNALTPENRQYLHDLPAGPLMIDDTVEICHGAPFDEDHYIFDAEDAVQALEDSERPLCLFGHTHLPVIFQRDGAKFEGYVPEGDEDLTIVLKSGVRYVVNPGSVGQPRDGDPRAAFALYDAPSAALLLRRVTYPVDAAQRAILVAGLPASLANRLAAGR
jgi:diadenosine tetraphosphatase ApaH/serine/threonine PP2A family protein phosphatase